MDFANAYVRGSEPLPPILEKPITVTELIDWAVQQPDRNKIIDETSFTIEINANVAFGFDEMFPDNYCVNSFGRFLELLEEKVYSDGSVQDMAYDLFEVDPINDVLYINVRGWVEIEEDVVFDKPRSECPFCKGKELAYSNAGNNLQRIECVISDDLDDEDGCGWYWRQPAIETQSSRRWRRSNPDEKLRELERRYAMEGGADLRSKINTNRIRMNLPLIPPILEIYGLRDPQYVPISANPPGSRSSYGTDVAIQSPVFEGVVLSSVIRQHADWYGVHHALLDGSDVVPTLAEHRHPKFPSPGIKQFLANHLHVFNLLETEQDVRQSEIQTQHPCLRSLRLYDLYNAQHFYLDISNGEEMPVSTLLNCRVCGKQWVGSCAICRMIVCNEHMAEAVCGSPVCADDGICGNTCNLCGQFVTARDGYLSVETGDWYCRTSPPCYANSPYILNQGSY